ncbi:uncharacterized protein LOC110735879 [Chenopodium quinoa]|uniref:uncharacterized protein LOC110735879 n=1 Tax=Chenopodium quinoa TaxID=63459 RepID=UPI000B7804E3|nr:uncharacterized protein LOC110735879 [Chenopodium quinoa]
MHQHIGIGRESDTNSDIYEGHKTLVYIIYRNKMLPSLELITHSEAGRECVWLRSMISDIQEECGMKAITENTTTIFEDNTTCISQDEEIDIQQIQSCDNLADLFTKSLPSKKFELLVHKIGMRHLRELC